MVVKVDDLVFKKSSLSIKTHQNNQTIHIQDTTKTQKQQTLKNNRNIKKEKQSNKKATRTMTLGVAT